jgi:hypothetical protein
MMSCVLLLTRTKSLPNPRMSRSFILIGPPRSGKTTIAKLLSERLRRDHVTMDSVRFDYYREIGYDDGYATELGARGGFWSVYRYWKPFEAHAVERILADHPDAVIDLGAGHSVYEDPGLFERVRRALEPFPHVILLLPSRDREESLRILQERDPSIEALVPGFSRHFLFHESNARLAKLVVYSKGMTPGETCDEICALLRAEPLDAV